MKLSFSKKRRDYIIICIVLSIIVTLIPWDMLNPRGFFIDRLSYLFAYDFKRFRLDGFYAESIYDYITNEWLWHYILSYSRNDLDISPEVFFGFITFVSFFAYSFFILKHNQKVVSLIYLFNPVFISFVYSQLRLSFAMALFLLAITFFNRKKTLLISLSLFLAAILIHTAMAIFVFLLLASVYISRMKGRKVKKIFFVVLIGFILNIMVGPLRYRILDKLDDRRAELDDSSSPAIYFIIYAMYFIVVIYYIFKYKLVVLNNYIYNYAFIIFSFIFFSVFLGGYTSRFVAATQCFIILSLFIMKGKISVLFHSLYITYLVLLWIGFFI